MNVLKFGGTSVATVERLDGVAEIVNRVRRRGAVAVVASARAGVTTNLSRAFALASRRDDGWRPIIDEIEKEHRARARALSGDDSVSAELEPWFEVLGEVLRLTARHASPRERDVVLATGERLSVPLVVAALRRRGLEAVAVDGASIVRTDEHFGCAEPDLEATRTLTREAFRALAPGTIPVVTGFLGATAAGDTTTLGRGGSDYTAAILGEALGADLVEIWKDVEGVLSADPAVVPHAVPIRQLGREEAAVLARLGAKVLHPRTIAPLLRANIALEVRSSLDPTAIGTRIDSWVPDERVARAVTSMRIATGCGTGSYAETSLISVVGHGIGEAAAIREEFFGALRAAGLQFDAHAASLQKHAVSVAVDPAISARAVGAVHDALVTRRRRVRLVVAGASGRVGSALLRQIGKERDRLRDEENLELRLVGASNSRGLAVRESGLEPSDVRGALERVRGEDWDPVFESVRARGGRDLVFVDCTASAEVASRYPVLLGAGVGVVTPNKIANASGFSSYRRLLALSRKNGTPYLYETSVGAGLPLLRTIAQFRESGDRIHSISAVLSGTVSFVLDCVNRGGSFAEAVREAVLRGLTEPDPRVDLSGEDVARKLVILAREAGFETERDEVHVEPLADESVDRVPLEDLIEHLRGFDANWHERVRLARDSGAVLAYVARVDTGGARASVEAVAADDPLAHATAGANVVVCRTDRYNDVPLSISGPGAGPEVTAAGVFADILVAARILAGGA